jgi:hypothetical protein
MLEEFEIEKPGESAAQRLVVLQNFLVERHSAGQNTVLILDEAQNLYPQTLEQIRLLSNFETTKEKILQIVLVGQPELLARLEMPELRQLKQRISIICQIPPMTRSGTRNYIRTRLRMAGARDLGLFTEDAVEYIVEYANGIPRIVNTVCDHCLLIGYADQTRRLDRGIVEQAITYLEAGARPSVRTRSAVGVRRVRGRKPAPINPFRWAVLGVSTAVVAGVAATMFYHPNLLPDAMDMSSSYLSDLMRSMRALIPR